MNALHLNPPLTPTLSPHQVIVSIDIYGRGEGARRAVTSSLSTPAALIKNRIIRAGRGLG